MALAIHKEQKSRGVFVVTPVGSIDSDTYVKLDDIMSRILDTSVYSVVIDMAGVDFLSSVGVGLVNKYQKELSGRNAELILLDMQPQVHKVFEIIRLLPSLTIFESTQELDDYLTKIQKSIIEKQK